MAKVLGDVMTVNVKTMQVGQSLLDAMVFMRDHGVRHIPVVDAEGALVGLISDRDVKRATPSALIQAQRDEWEQVTKEITLDRIMNRGPLTVTPASPLKESVKTMVEEKIGCLIVATGDRIEGIVTSHDLLKAMHELL